MPEIPPASQSSKRQHEFAAAIPELELEDFRKIIKAHFGITCEPTDEPYLVRFQTPGYEVTDEKYRSTSVSAHHRGKGGKLLLSPHNIKHVLEKFNISESDFMGAYELSMKKVEPIRPTPPPSSTPPKDEPPKQAS
jgi:hypothetical protein